MFIGVNVTASAMLCPRASFFRAATVHVSGGIFKDFSLIIRTSLKRRCGLSVFPVVQLAIEDIFRTAVLHPAYVPSPAYSSMATITLSVINIITFRQLQYCTALSETCLCDVTLDL